MTNRYFRGALGASLIACLSTSALGHAALERKEATPNSAYRGIVQIMHGCEGAPTTRISVTIPEGVIGAKAMPKPGWEVTTTRGAYAKSYPYYHGPISEGVKTITWSGGNLPDDQVDEFTFFARITDAFAPGSTVHFPIEQDCGKGSLHWVEIPAEGQDAHALKAPAPGIRIVAATPADAAAQTGSTRIKAGDVAIETPWMRATPGGARVAGGYVTLTNTGSTPDRLIAAAIPQAGRGEIHEMTVEGGVMKMAALEKGIVIGPGKTVALKPGGLHLMFLDLKSGPKAGETIAGTLTFERAGTVPVTFTVAPIGAQSPTGSAAPAEAGGGHHNH